MWARYYQRSLYIKYLVDLRGVEPLTPAMRMQNVAVDQMGIEPTTSSMRMKRSTDELLAQNILILPFLGSSVPSMEQALARCNESKQSSLLLLGVATH